MLLGIDYLFCFLGWFVYTLFLFVRDKNAYDKLEKPFNIQYYFKFNWDNMLFGIVAAFSLLLIAPDIYFYLSVEYIFMKNIFWSNKIPFFIGSFGAVMFQGLYDIVKLFIDKIKNKVK